jgi:hypothetical protein
VGTQSRQERLSSLTFVCFGQMGGEFKEIGEVKMSRLPAGKRCAK